MCTSNSTRRYCIEPSVVLPRCLATVLQPETSQINVRVFNANRSNLSVVCTGKGQNQPRQHSAITTSENTRQTKHKTQKSHKRQEKKIKLSINATCTEKKKHCYQVHEHIATEQHRRTDYCCTLNKGNVANHSDQKIK